jgi:hypothetical protein
MPEAVSPPPHLSSWHRDVTLFYFTLLCFTVLGYCKKQEIYSFSLNTAEYQSVIVTTLESLTNLMRALKHTNNL